MTVIHPPTGTKLSCKGWIQEAAFRMIQHNLDPDVAERPEDLVVYGGTGKAARDWPSFHRILDSLKSLENDETLLVQSGKPVGIFRSHEDAPRVLIANSNLVGKWATWEHFRELEKRGLMMFGQMTAGSWIYIGTQGILQGTFETFAAAGRTHYGTDDLSGRFILSAGLGGMGGAQPLAAAMTGAAFLGIEVDPHRIQRRLETEYLDEVADNLDDALARIDKAKAEKRALSVGLCANAADIYPELVKRGVVPDLVTDQTSAHDPLNGYVPRGHTLEEAIALRSADPDRYVKESKASMAVHVEAMVDLMKKGAHVFDYGNNIRAFRPGRRLRGRVRLPRLRPRVHPPALLRRPGPVPLGRPLRRSRRHPRHRGRAPRGRPGRPTPPALDRPRPQQGPLPGSPEPHLLARQWANAPRSAPRSTTS